MESATLTHDAQQAEAERLMWFWLREGWKFRGINKLSKALQKEYGDRTKYEMELIKSKDFVDYFLMLSDAVRHTKDAGIPVGPARGSAAASLVCYLMRITEVDPMHYPLMLFERFIDPNRHDLPDVDLDFDDEQRDFVRQHMIGRYGANRVGNIGTFTKYKAKNSIDDVARVYQIPHFAAARAKEFMVERSGGDSRQDASILDTVEMFPQVKEIFDQYPDLYKTVHLEGNYKSFGVHAAGVVVGADELNRYVATYTRHDVGKEKKTLQVLSVDKYDGEPMGLMKLDALGLSTMGMLRNCLELTGKPLSFLYDIPMDDPETLKAFEIADVVGIFQFEGRTTKMVTEEMRPKNFMDLVAINALSRPGPLHSGTTGEYLAIRHGQMDYHSLHPMIDEICKDTEGQIIYQEQILKITRDIGKFPWTHAAAIRKIISSKKGEGAFNAMWADFEKGAATVGIYGDTAREIWKRMATAGSYAFNIAHCVSYSMIGFWSMYFKVHHPAEFYTASLRKQEDNDRQLGLMRDAQDRRYGREIKILPPSPDKSSATWSSEPEGVRAGLRQVPGIGEKVAGKMLAFRDEFGVSDWADYAPVNGVGPKTLERFKEFADNDDPFGIDWIANNRKAIIAWIRQHNKTADPFEILPIPDTLADAVPYEDKPSRHVILGVLKNRNLQDLFENHRSRTGEELDPKTVKDAHLKDSMTLYLEDPAGLMTAKVNRWKYTELKDELWDAKVGQDFILARVFKKAFLGKTVHIDRMWVITP